LGVSSNAPGRNDAEEYNENNNENNDDYNSGNDRKAPAGAVYPPEDKKLRQVYFLHGTVYTNEDYGLVPMTCLLDTSADAQALFKAMDLPAPTFFTSCLLVHAGWFFEEDLPIFFRCLF
jgi:hypothetical protein